MHPLVFITKAMNKTRNFLILCLAVSALYATDGPNIVQVVTEVKSSRIRLEEPIAIVYGPKRDYVICSSELTLPTFDGKPPSLQEAIIEEAYLQKALVRGMPLDDMAKKHFAAVKAQLRMTDEQIEETCTKWGMSIPEVYEKFKKMGARSSLVEYDIIARIFIPEHEVEKAYEQKPIFHESQYQLQISNVPYTAARPIDEQQQDIKNAVIKNPQSVRWGQAFWIPESDLADDKNFITKMTVNDVEAFLCDEGYFEVIKLCQKQDGYQVPLQQCYKDILTDLRKPKMQEMLDKYTEDLLKSVAVVSLDTTHKPESSFSC